jgi:predicted ester cyclase
MAPHELETLYCRFVESVMNRNRLDHLDEFLAADVIDHSPARTIGLEAARRTLTEWLAGFADLHVIIEDLVVDGDRLMARLTATGTYHAGLTHVAPSKVAHVSATAFEVWAVRDNRCAERWLRLDMCEFSRQLPAHRPASEARYGVSSVCRSAG